jgi:hypothetical protein
MLSRQRGIASYCNDRQFVMLGRQSALDHTFFFFIGSWCQILCRIFVQSGYEGTWVVFSI